VGDDLELLRTRRTFTTRRGPHAAALNNSGRRLCVSLRAHAAFPHRTLLPYRHRAHTALRTTAYAPESLDNLLVSTALHTCHTPTSYGMGCCWLHDDGKILFYQKHSQRTMPVSGACRRTKLRTQRDSGAFLCGIHCASATPAAAAPQRMVPHLPPNKWALDYEYTGALNDISLRRHGVSFLAGWKPLKRLNRLSIDRLANSRWTGRHHKSVADKHHLCILRQHTATTGTCLLRCCATNALRPAAAVYSYKELRVNIFWRQ